LLRFDPVLAALELARCCKVIIGLVEVTLVPIGDPTVVISFSKVRIEPDRIGKVADRILVQLFVIVGLPALKICFRIQRWRWCRCWQS
jgi:hypothetical protein